MLRNSYQQDSLSSVFGGTGFLGGNYCRMYPDETITIPRSEVCAKTNNILYFISTIDNYNVFYDTHLDINTNLNKLVDVLDKLERNNNTIINFISSWFVYGKTDSLPVKETAQCDPKGFYSITKRAAEQLLVSYCETFGISYRILRLCNVYGYGDTKSSLKRNALQYLINEIRMNRDVKLYNYGFDTRDIMHVDDVCRAINTVIKLWTTNDIINIGSGIPHRFIDMMNYVRDTTNSLSEFIFVNPPKFHQIVQVNNMHLDVSKLNNLNFTPKIDIKTGINLLINRAC
jgi:nucleoside-diphosphate-sugar epimerase